jgi:hypothetical protein
VNLSSLGFNGSVFLLTLGYTGLANAACSAQAPPFFENIQAQIIVVGEVHGTQEMPAFVEKLVCYYAKKKVPLLLGLEMPSEEQLHLSAYHLSGGTPQDKAQLFKAGFWKWGGKTGQASAAVFNLMEHVRKLESDGHSVFPFFYGMSGDVIALGNDKEDFNINNDLVMAANVYARAINYKTHKLVILSGNRHAKKAGEPYSMASFLEKFTPVFSINFMHLGGKTWGCHGTPMTCGVYSVNPATAQRQAGFDAIVALGELHAAPPAIAE